MSTIEAITLLCSCLPDLYAGLVDRVGLNLIEEVNQILQQRLDPVHSGTAQMVLHQAVKAMSSVFNSLGDLRLP